MRVVLPDRDDITEKRMFGGLAFMLAGNMSVGVIKDGLVVRATREDEDRLRTLPHTRPMEFTGRPMKYWIYVDPEGAGSGEGLRGWVAEAWGWSSTPAADSLVRPTPRTGWRRRR